MKKRFLLALATALCAVAMMMCVACQPTAQTSDSSSDALFPDYSEDSLVQFHEDLGSPLTSTEVSKETCGGGSECHGTWQDIQAKTEGMLTIDENVLSKSVNPHANHMIKELECTECHNLTGPSTLRCDEACHDWQLSVTNGLWTGEGIVNEPMDGATDDSAADGAAAESATEDSSGSAEGDSAE